MLPVNIGDLYNYMITERDTITWILSHPDYTKDNIYKLSEIGKVKIIYASNFENGKVHCCTVTKYNVSDYVNIITTSKLISYWVDSEEVRLRKNIYKYNLPILPENCTKKEIIEECKLYNDIRMSLDIVSFYYPLEIKFTVPVQLLHCDKSNNLVSVVSDTHKVEYVKMKNVYSRVYYYPYIKTWSIIK